MAIRILSLFVTILGSVVTGLGILALINDYRNKVMTKEDFLLITFLFLSGLSIALVGSKVFFS